ncbi:MAG: DUF4838 domain-containing protein [Akkermansiaceae bacterium]|nr:DUF4838 domain-containing protein [Akkermansiaceae bacterium]
MKRPVPIFTCLRSIGLVLLAGFVLTISSSLVLAQSEGGQAINLADGGKTNYQIVADPAADGIETYAAETLAGYLKEMTGAEFPVVAPEARDSDRPAIFIGLSEPALALLEDGDPLAGLSDEEHVARSVGPHVLLYGKGHRASLYATMEFLENSLGWRWYSPFEKPVVPKRSTLTLEPFSRQRGFDFVSRQLAARFNGDFYLQHGINMGLDTKLLNRGEPVPGHLRSWMPNENFVHTTFSYIPPTSDAEYADEFPWLEKRNYFETHPEFFSIGENGERVPNLQLCFSNRGLRAELTKNVRKQLSISGDRQIIMIDAADRPGRFCHCADCVALEEKHATPGGPLFDFLIELSENLRKDHPETRVKTLAYRRSQTQIPPKLPEGERLPDNLIVDFAPIEDCYFADWTHPDPNIQETFRHLKDWAAITAPGNLWTWMYPNPWGTGNEMPVGNVGRVVTNLRLMHGIGVRGLFLDHNGVNSRGGWSELQAFLVLKLSRDIDADVDALIAEFTGHAFGPAAPRMREYLAELEASRKAMTTLPPGVTYKSRNLDDRTFPYLTPANIHRWRQWFDEMETVTAKLPRELANVRSQRRELDLATLWKWFDLRAAWPGLYTDHRPFAERVLAANKAKSAAGIAPAWQLGEELVARFVTLIDAGGEKPLPGDFDGIDRDRIRTFLPRNHARGEQNRSVPDAEAAFGTAAVVDQPGDPFRCGFSEWKSRVPSVVTHGPRLEIPSEGIVPGEYHLHPLGEIDLTTDDSLIWFGRSWATNIEIGSQLWFPGETNRWKAWVSLKFTGPAYGGEGEDRVLCDRVILVRQSEE